MIVAGLPRLLPLVIGYTVGLMAHLRCHPDDAASVTANETVIIFTGIGGALAAAALIAFEMRMAVAPAQTPAA